MIELTEEEKTVYNIAREFLIENKYSITLMELMTMLGCKRSKSYDLIIRLQYKGYFIRSSQNRTMCIPVGTKIDVPEI